MLPGSPSARVVLKNVGKRYGNETALDDVTLECSAGQMVGLIGRNGAGKSTLLRLIAQVARPTTGEVEYVVNGRTQAQRPHMGYIGHQCLLYGDLSPLENLRFFAQAYRISDPMGEVERALDRFGLRSFRHRLTKFLSRGMLQRVGLARSFLGSPPVLVLDEPFSGLDEESSALLESECRAAIERDALTIIASHDLERMASMANVLVCLHQGRIAAHVQDPVASHEIRMLLRQAAQA
jgi:heme exporter protein A